jgi:hypothetical protein
VDIHQNLKLQFVFLHPAKKFLLYLKFHLLSKLNHYILLLRLNTWKITHQKLKLLFEFHNLLNNFLQYLNQIHLLSKLNHHILLLHFVEQLEHNHQKLNLQFVVPAPANAILAVPKFPPGLSK